MRRVVVDASSLVRAALTPDSAARKLVEAVLARGLVTASAPILDEVEEVLARSKFARWLPEADRLRFARRLRIGALLVTPGSPVRACRDPSDDKYLEAALAATGAAGGVGAEPGRGAPVRPPIRTVRPVAAPTRPARRPLRQS